MRTPAPRSDFEVEEDDGFAWEDKGKGTSGKRKASNGKGTNRVRKSGGSARKGSAGSARGPAGSSRSGTGRGGDVSDSSARTKRRAPPPRKQDNTTAVLAISALTGGMLIAGGIFFVRKVAPSNNKIVTDDNEPLTAALDKIKTGKSQFNEFNKLMNSGKRAQARQMGEKALKNLQEGNQELTALLQRDPYVDAQGYTKPEYEGYEEEQQQSALLIIDIEKRMDRGSDEGEGE